MFFLFQRSPGKMKISYYIISFIILNQKCIQTSDVPQFNFNLPQYQNTGGGKKNDDSSGSPGEDYLRGKYDERHQPGGQNYENPNSYHHQDQPSHYKNKNPNYQNHQNQHQQNIFQMLSVNENPVQQGPNSHSFSEQNQHHYNKGDNNRHLGNSRSETTTPTTTTAKNWFNQYVGGNDKTDKESEWKRKGLPNPELVHHEGDGFNSNGDREPGNGNHINPYYGNSHHGNENKNNYYERPSVDEAGYDYEDTRRKDSFRHTEDKRPPIRTPHRKYGKHNRIHEIDHYRPPIREEMEKSGELEQVPQNYYEGKHNFKFMGEEENEINQNLMHYETEPEPDPHHHQENPPSTIQKMKNWFLGSSGSSNYIMDIVIYLCIAVQVFA